MGPGVETRRMLSRPQPVGLPYFAVTAAAAGVGLAVLALQQNTGPWGWTAGLAPVVGLVHIATGLLAWTRRPRNRMGPLLCTGGLLWFATSGSTIDNPLFFAVGLITQTTVIAFVVHALLAYPSGRLRGRTSWLLTVGIYVTATVLQAPLYLFRTLGDEPAVLWVADRPDVVSAVRNGQAVVGLAILGATGVVLIRRLIAVDRQQRRVLLPVYATGAFVVLFVTSIYEILRALGFGPQPIVDVIQISIISLVPVAFVTGVLLGGFARTGELDELAEWLGTRGARPDVQYAVARTLGDPSVRLAHAFGSGWVDGNGLPMTLPEPDSPVAVAYVELDNRPVGAILYDRSLNPDVKPVDAAGRVVAIALDRQRLTAQLLASQEELRESRTRLVQAGDQERRRLAQDLHDRLQGRLILLALRVGNASPGDDLVDIRRGLDDSITELRWLVQGVMPALLMERGLGAAVEDLADRMPIRTELDFGDLDLATRERLPEPVEGTAYAVIAEALTNAVKRSAASRITVRVRRHGAHLQVQVRDDGVGGAAPTGGLGLRGMTDRVHALGGRFDIVSRVAEGTVVTAELPCAS